MFQLQMWEINKSSLNNIDSYNRPESADIDSIPIMMWNSFLFYFEGGEGGAVYFNHDRLLEIEDRLKKKVLSIVCAANRVSPPPPSEHPAFNSTPQKNSVT